MDLQWRWSCRNGREFTWVNEVMGVISSVVVLAEEVEESTAAATLREVLNVRRVVICGDAVWNPSTRRREEELATARSHALERRILISIEQCVYWYWRNGDR